MTLMYCFTEVIPYSDDHLVKEHELHPPNHPFSLLILGMGLLLEFNLLLLKELPSETEHDGFLVILMVLVIPPILD